MADEREGEGCFLRRESSTWAWGLFLFVCERTKETFDNCGLLQSLERLSSMKERRICLDFSTVAVSLLVGDLGTIELLFLLWVLGDKRRSKLTLDILESMCSAVGSFSIQFMKQE